MFFGDGHCTPSGSKFGATLALAACLAAVVGCAPSASPNGEPEAVWGRRGGTKARFQKPRAMTVDAEDNLYIVDMTGRIQVFTPDGEYLRAWRTPTIQNGKPSGLSMDREGNILVADTHYFQVLTYTKTGELLKERTIGGECGHGPGQFNFVTDAVQDSQGRVFVAEYGEHDRIQMFDAKGEFLCEWGENGSEPMQFIRPNSLALDADERLWVADACNHRIQVFEIKDNRPVLVKMWGMEGAEPGRMRYPYDLTFDRDGNVLVAEFGNHRVQKFTPEGESIAVWGSPGRREGEFQQPWALVCDGQGRVHVLDTYNHRVQQIRL